MPADMREYDWVQILGVAVLATSAGALCILLFML
jgi:hypothetical protein